MKRLPRMPVLLPVFLLLAQFAFSVDISSEFPDARDGATELKRLLQNMRERERVQNEALTGLSEQEQTLQNDLHEARSSLQMQEEFLKRLYADLEKLKTTSTELTNSLQQSKRSLSFWRITALVGIPAAFATGLLIGLIN